MVARLAFQVFSLALFMLVCFDFGWRVRRSSCQANPQFSWLRLLAKVKAFLVGKHLPVEFLDPSYKVRDSNQLYLSPLSLSSYDVSTV